MSLERGSTPQDRSGLAPMEGTVEYQRGRANALTGMYAVLVAERDRYRAALVEARSTMQRQMLSDGSTEAPFNEDMDDAIRRADEALAV